MASLSYPDDSKMFHADDFLNAPKICLGHGVKQDKGCVTCPVFLCEKG